jgi:transitional endoplasmic reticulum ATPase
VIFLWLKRSIILGVEKDEKQIVEMLKQEASRKSPSNIIYLDSKSTFDFKMVNSEPNLIKFHERLISSAGQKNFSVLLYGPPGTGKSFYIRKLAAEIGFECIEKKASELLNSYSGQTEKAIANTFLEARERKAFLLFDEIDSLISARNSEDAGSEKSKVNEMLTWIDDHPYPIAATTNFIDGIDSAAERRFLFKIKLDYLKPEQISYACSTIFGFEPTKEILQNTKLTPAFFYKIKKKASVFGIDNKKDIIDLIMEEREFSNVKKFGFV